MRKTIATIAGMGTLLAMAVPAFARMPRMPRLPDINANVAVIQSEVEAEANTGDNELMVNGMQQVASRKHHHSRPESAWGEIDTGDAMATALANITIGRQENGCCEEDMCQDPCYNPCRRSRCGYQPQPDAGEIDLNLAWVDSEVEAEAETGDNRLRVQRGSGRILTGMADAYAEGNILVNVQVNDLN